jgi:hypothetical protein
MNAGSNPLPPAHKPTLGYAAVIIVVVVVGYHFLAGKGRK